MLTASRYFRWAGPKYLGRWNSKRNKGWNTFIQLHERLKLVHVRLNHIDEGQISREEALVVYRLLRPLLFPLRTPWSAAFKLQRLDTKNNARDIALEEQKKAKDVQARLFQAVCSLHKCLGLSPP